LRQHRETQDVPELFYTRELPNGLTLLGQRMETVSSAAMTLVVPAGAAHDSPGDEGAAAVASEWLFRGAGDRDTRALNDALDSLGCQHSEAVQSEHIHLSAVQLGRNLPAVLSIYADILRRARLENATFDPCRALTLQDLASLEDEPAHKCSLMLRERFYPRPLGQCVYGRAESLQALAAETVRKHVARRWGPRGTILALAGNMDWNALCDLVETLLGDWSGPEPAHPQTRPPEDGETHVRKDSAQVHIALAHRAVPIRDGRYYAARMAETVLSGGMSSRLFTEVREKRGLVYNVGCRYHSLLEHAGMFTYAGTRPDLAQQTFDVTVREIRRLAEGVGEDELARARTQLKSAVVLQGESTSSRANSIASDWFHLRRLRGLQEVSEAIEKVTAGDVLAYLRDFPARDFTVLVVGPSPLDTSVIREN
jgi:predicted Zn-dependent peptidase